MENMGHIRRDNEWFPRRKSIISAEVDEVVDLRDCGNNGSVKFQLFGLRVVLLIVRCFAETESAGQTGYCSEDGIQMLCLPK